MNLFNKIQKRNCNGKKDADSLIMKNVDFNIYLYIYISDILKDCSRLHSTHCVVPLDMLSRGEKSGCVLQFNSSCSGSMGEAGCP